MYIDSLKLINYRNYDNLHVEFNKDINLIVGKNGQGKTNIVESLTLMSIGKSFRSSKDKEIIKFGKDNLYCGCTFLKNGLGKKIEVMVTKDKKGIKVNGVSIKSIQELLGTLNVVVFSPEDLKLVKDGPKERRGFIDREISQIMPRYYSNLTMYNKTINQRNKVLKSNKIDHNLLDVYDEHLSLYGSEIYSTRMKFIEKLSKISNKLHNSLTSNSENMSIIYKSQINITEDDTVDTIKDKMDVKLKDSREHDIFYRSTKIGPHRDDLSIFVNDIDVRLYGSQGQQRTVSISLKLSEIELIKQELGDYPVLILDDVFSELDQTRQRMLVEKLGDIQMFVTSADPLHKNILGKKNYTIFNIEEGKIVDIENGGK
ncbi:DNA replication/repair protein RecF [Peptostreptococcus faecalis]|uniref:DNA replication/repair protein RecF n=1 Tax=Peptostreptococcus faecalis TaxID=2045015 RepID=UPI000C7D8C90|nr:DNA replication/repair protein RecF [Peptostreptococcus faecalis]